MPAKKRDGVYKQPLSPYWSISYVDENGVRKKRSTKTRDREEALQIRERVLKGVRERRCPVTKECLVGLPEVYCVDGRARVKVLAKQYLELIKDKPYYIDRRSHINKWVIPLLGNHEIRALSAYELETCVWNEMLSLGKATSTIRKVLVALNQILKTAIKHGGHPELDLALIAVSRTMRMHVPNARVAQEAQDKALQGLRTCRVWPTAMSDAEIARERKVGVKGVMQVRRARGITDSITRLIQPFLDLLHEMDQHLVLLEGEQWDGFALDRARTWEALVCLLAHNGRYYPDWVWRTFKDVEWRTGRLKGKLKSRWMRSVDWSRVPLGRRTDVEIAALVVPPNQYLGLSAADVKAVRTVHGVKGYGSSRIRCPVCGRLSAGHINKVTCGRELCKRAWASARKYDDPESKKLAIENYKLRKEVRDATKE